MDVHGFRSVDEQPSRATHSKVILHEGEDLMSIQAKKNFHFDSEAERENAIQANFVSNNMAWIFVDKELILLSLNSTKWPEKLKPSQKMSMIEGQRYDLRRKEDISQSPFNKGNLKYVERAMLSYQEEMD